MIAAALLSASSSSTSSSSSSSMTTAAAAALKTGEKQVRTLIPVTTADGSKLFVSGPCIVLKTNSGTTPKAPAPTVAQQMQALRPLIKADTNVFSKKNNDTNNNSNNRKPKLSITSRTADSISEGLSVSKTAGPTMTMSSLSPGSNTENEPHEALRVKRRMDFSALGLPRPQPATMARRNERERNRVKQVNMGFEVLRQHVPQGRKNKKLSKVDTLKEAVKYISYLHQLLTEADKEEGGAASGDEDTKSGLTTSIADTITIVSRPTASTTSSGNTNESFSDESSDLLTATPSPSPYKTSSRRSSSSSLVSTSTNTTTFIPSDLLHQSGKLSDSVASVAVERSAVTDYIPVHHRNDMADETDGDSFVYNANVNMPDEMGSEQMMDYHQQMAYGSVTRASQGTTVDSDYSRDKRSPARFVELAPAHNMNFLNLRSVSASSARTVSTNTTTTEMELDNIGMPVGTSSPSAAATAMVDQFGHYSASSAVSANVNIPHATRTATTPTHFLDLNQPTPTSSPGGAYSPVEGSRLNTSLSHSLPQHQFSRYFSASELEPLRPTFVDGKADHSTRGSMYGGASDGSCPVSPSESSDMSHGEMEMSGGETWQDLTAVAEWLCSKFDIEDSDVFV